MIEWIEFLVLGVVQGLTEFLPISSDGHLNVVQKLFALGTGVKPNDKQTIFFFVMLHLGTTAAILAHYWRAIKDGYRGLRDRPDAPEEFRKSNVIRVLALAFVATLPLIPDALFLKKLFEEAFEGLRITAVGFLITAAMLAICGRLRGGEKGPRQTTYLDALIVGIAQMFAPLPGVSRSGLTITAALALGFSRTWAVGFSLLLAVPAIMGATVFELRHVNASLFTSQQIVQAAAATVVAGLVGYLAIVWLVRIVRNGRLWYFSVYLVILGLALLISRRRWEIARMAATKKIWISRFGPELLDRVAREAPIGRSTLWIAPSPLARDQLLSSATRHRQYTAEPRIWTWDDLWQAVREGRPEGPILIPTACERVVLIEALGQVRDERMIQTIAAVADTRGFQRRLRRAFREWTRRELDPRRVPPGPSTPISRAEWTIYGRYRQILKSLQFEDAAGFSTWASTALRESPPPNLVSIESVVVFEPIRLDPAKSRALDAFQSRVGSMTVALSGVDDPEREESVAPTSPIMEKLAQWGFESDASDEELARPAGLNMLVNTLFREDLAAESASPSSTGLWVLGAPRGEGHALVVAARVRKLLEKGSDPSDIVIVVPSWDDDAEILADTMRAWKIPFTSRAPLGLSRAPAIRALRSAAWLAAKGWEADRLVRLLRNGQLHPRWPEVGNKIDLAEAAAAIQSLRVFRGQDAIRRSLERLEASRDEARDSERRKRFTARARVICDLFERIVAALPTAREAAAWMAHVERLRGIAAELGIGGSDGDEALEQFWIALEEQGSAYDALGRSGDAWTWSDFMTEVDRVTPELSLEPKAAARSAVSIVTPDGYDGSACHHLIIANFTEGTFPRPSELEPGASTNDDGHESREAARFSRLVASARKSLTIAYPTTDEKGNELLPAGFFEDVRVCFSEAAWRKCHIASNRLEAVPRAELAVAPADARVRAVALALDSEGGDLEMLRRIGRSTDHRRALEGVAAALEVNDARHRSRDFGPFEGMLTDPDAARRIAANFAPDRPAFSPSQLETLALCPFQFFSRFVLRLTPLEELGELDDDRAARGSLIHKALETLHLQLRDADLDPGHSLDARVSQILSELNQERPVGSDLEAGLREIRKLRLLRIGRRYSGQLGDYAQGVGSRFECHELEVEFGSVKNANSRPALVIGDGDGAVRLQGKIDRVDRIVDGGEPRFRVIDYKTGRVHTAKELHSGLAMQLPLYALAVERLGEVGDYSDFGYWGLREKGYKTITLGKKGDAGNGWPSYRERLEAYVIDLVARMRQAKFPVSPRTDGCESHCDFSAVCRIKQVRASGKVWEDAPRMEPRE